MPHFPDATHGCSHNRCAISDATSATVSNGIVLPVSAVVLVDGLPFTAVTMDGFVDHVANSALLGNGGWVVTPNTDILRRYRTDAAFRDLVAPATHFIADGMPIVWASRLQGTPLPERVAGSDAFVRLCQVAAASGIPVLMIGGSPGSAAAAAAALCQRFHGLKVEATFCPPVGFESNAATMAYITEVVSRQDCCFIFVGLGSPKQEQLISLLRHRAPKSWWFGIGASFSFIAGDIARAPGWMRHIGAEWLYRLGQEPRRLFVRYLIHGVPFALGLFWRAVLARRDYRR